MLRPLDEGRSVVVASHHAAGCDEWRTLYEVPGPHGVVDALFALFDGDVLDDRLRGGFAPILNWYEMVVFARLQQAGSRGMPIADLADAVGMTVAGLKRGALTRLSDAGHIRVGSHLTHARWQYRSPAHYVIAIEAKRTDWSRAVAQASAYCEYTDSAYIALEPRPAQRAATSAYIANSGGVGVVSVDPETMKVQLLHRAVRLRPNPVKRALFVEQALSLLVAGRVSGPVRPVYGLRPGQDVADPRLVAVRAQ
ncbi:hypothetical protein ABQF35_11120 [Mycobacterium syngnathidarum]